MNLLEKLLRLEPDLKKHERVEEIADYILGSCLFEKNPEQVL